MAKQYHSRRTDAGFTLIEVLLVTAIIGLLAAMAFPNLRRARLAANESSAIGSLRTIGSAQQSFWSSCGAGMYASSLEVLGRRVAGMPGYLSPDLAGAVPVVKSGYEFDLDYDEAGPTADCHGETTAEGYRVTADPQVGQGRRFFGLNTLGVIYQSPETLYTVMTDDTAPPAPATPASQH